LPAYEAFNIKLKPFVPTSDKSNMRLQFCHRLLHIGLYYSSSGHIIPSYDPISQMKIIDTSLQFLNVFSLRLNDKEYLRQTLESLLLKEKEDQIKKEEAEKQALVEEAARKIAEEEESLLERESNLFKLIIKIKK
jgi:hypothetical protein